MPTATEVENRPVSVGGKWPRNRRLTGAHNRHQQRFQQRSSAERRSDEHAGQQTPDTVADDVQPHQLLQQTLREEHRDCCTLENCTFGHDEGSNSCTDVLLQPELLQEFYGDRVLSSSSPLLEFCLDGGFLFSKCSTDENNQDLSSTTPATTKPFPVPALLATCSSIAEETSATAGNFVATLSQHLRQKGCDINVQDQQGSTALHLLIRGCSKDNFPTVLESVKLLLGHTDQPDLTLTDREGDTPLTKIGRVLLRRGLYVEALELARALLHEDRALDWDQSGLVNHVNGEQRTLLTYSVSCGDDCLELTLALLNCGARILPDDVSVSTERDRSSFTWLVRGIINNSGSTSNSGWRQLYGETLDLLCQNLEPETLRSHALTTMVHLGPSHGSGSLGRLFLELRDAMSPFWARPQTLAGLCRKTIRLSAGPKNLASLNLPTSLTQYLLYFQEQQHQRRQ